MNLIQRASAQPHQQRKKDNICGSKQRRSDLGLVVTRMLTFKAQPGDNEWQSDNPRQSAPQQASTQVPVCHYGHQASVWPGAEQSKSERYQQDGCVKGNRSEAEEAIERFYAKEVTL